MYTTAVIGTRLRFCSSNKPNNCCFLWDIYVLDNKLNFNKNTDFIYKRCQPRIFCLQKLRSLKVSAAVLRTFYRSCIESVLTFSFLCWFGGLNVKSKNVLNKVMNVCDKVVGERPEQLSQLYDVWYGRLG